MPYLTLVIGEKVVRATFDRTQKIPFYLSERDVFFENGGDVAIFTYTLQEGDRGLITIRENPLIRGGSFTSGLSTSYRDRSPILSNSRGDSSGSPHIFAISPTPRFLTGLTVSKGSLTPMFEPDILDYSMKVDKSVTSLTVTATTLHSSPPQKISLSYRSNLRDEQGAAGSIDDQSFSHHKDFISPPVPLEVGSTSIGIHVEKDPAGDSTFSSISEYYEIQVTREGVPFHLSALTFSEGELTPSFARDTYTYVLRIPYHVTSLTVTPTAFDPDATIRVNDHQRVSDPVVNEAQVSSGTATPIIIPYSVPTAITIVVTAQDGTATRTYEVQVVREDAPYGELSYLSLSEGELTPSFAHDTYTYVLRIPYHVTSLTVTPTASPDETITVNEAQVASGTASPALPLEEVGDTVIPIAVTAQDGTTTTYTVRVTREDIPNAALSGLSLSEGELTPSFARDTLTYTARVPYRVTSLTVTPTAVAPDATIMVNEAQVSSGTASPALPLEVGDTLIPIAVTAQDGTTTTYTVRVTRGDPNAALSGLSLSEGELTPSFARDTLTYTARVPYRVTSLTVTTTAVAPDATIMVNEAQVSSGTASPALPLEVGDTLIPIVVTAQDGTTTTTYTVRVTRGIKVTMGETEYTINDRRVTVKGEAGIPANVEINLPPTLDRNVEVTIAPPASNVPLEGGRFGFGEGDTRTVVDISVSSVPTGGLEVCLPVAEGLRTEAGSRDLMLLHYTGQVWEPVRGSMIRGDRVCATGVTDFSPYAVGYVRTSIQSRDLGLVLAGVGRTLATDAVEILGGRFGIPASRLQVTLGGQAVRLTESAAPSPSPLEEEGRGEGSLLRGEGHKPAATPSHRVTGLAIGVARAFGVALDTPAGAPSPLEGEGRGEGSFLQSEKVNLRRPNGWQAPLRLQPHSMKDILARSSFELPLTRTGDDGMPAWTLWGRGSATGFSGQPENDFKMDGNLYSGYVGVDYRPQASMLLGLAVAHSTGTVDYERIGPTKAGVDVAVTSVLPYAHWQPRPGLGVWGLVGAGWGDMDIKLAGEDRTRTTDLTSLMGAVGGRQALTTWQGIDLAAKTDAFLSTMRSAGKENLPGARGHAERVRLLVEGRTEVVLSEVSRMQPRLEIGGRWDSGTAEQGLGAELGGGVAYTQTAWGLSVEAQGRYLLAHEDGAFEDWGASLNLRLDPGIAGEGAYLTMSPVWGQAASGTDQLWGNATALQQVGGRPRPATGWQPASLAIDLGYGLALADGRGIVTPYGGLALAGPGSSRYRLGSRMALSSSLDVNVEGERAEQPGQAVSHGVSVRLGSQW